MRSRTIEEASRLLTVGRMIWKRRETAYRTIVRTGQALIRALAMRVRVSGAEHLPAAVRPGERRRRFRPVRPGTGAVVAITHSSLLDFVFAEAAVFPAARVHMRFMIAMRYSRSRFMEAINGLCGHIPVDRDRPAGAVERAVRVLCDGDWVAMFPEGGRNHAIRPGELRTGAVRMAAQAGVPVVPVAVFGGGRLLGGGEGFRWARLWRAPISVVIGEPLTVGPDEDVRAATARLRDALGVAVDRAIASFPGRLEAGAPWVPADLGGGAPTVEEAEVQRRARKGRLESDRSR